MNPLTSWPWKTALTVGMPCTRSACAMRGLASTSILASTHAPLPSTASFSSIGESCLHGPHHSAHRSITTGVRNERSSTSVWNVASVTSMTVTAAGAVAVRGGLRLGRGLRVGAFAGLVAGLQDGQVDRAGQGGGHGGTGRGRGATRRTTRLHASSVVAPLRPAAPTPTNPQI